MHTPILPLTITCTFSDDTKKAQTLEPAGLQTLVAKMIRSGAEIRSIRDARGVEFTLTAEGVLSFKPPAEEASAGQPSPSSPIQG